MKCVWIVSIRHVTLHTLVKNIRVNESLFCYLQVCYIIYKYVPVCLAVYHVVGMFC